jgi:methylenetetrahydrofolate dehydrogenase (NADP+)/methenyltetrahydrofolate cyclohydrolase
MIVDGRRIASDILAGVKASLARAVIVRAVTVAPTPATESYLSIKAARAEEAGMHLEVVRLEARALADEVLDAVRRPGADAVIVQLPLPDHLDQAAILDAISPEKDADVLSEAAYRAFEQGEGVMPPVASAIAHILIEAKVTVTGARAVVVGQGKLVGKPAVVLLRALGADVSVVTKESGDLSALKDADIVVLGAGSPGLVKPEHLKNGVALIDAGTSEQGRAIVGDAEPECATVASVFTPVPGGVGPVAVACLFRNVAALIASPLQEG